MSEELPRDVLITLNGGLLLTGGAHSVLDIFNGTRRPADGSPKMFWQNQMRRQSYCDDRDISYVYTVFPDKIVPYASFLDDRGIQSVYLKHYAGSSGSASVGSLYLQLSADDYRLTDTHLSAEGMIASVCQIMKLLGGELGMFAEEFRNHYMAHLVDDPSFVGDLGAKFNPPRSERTKVIKGANRGIHVTNGMAGGNDGVIDLVKNPDAMTNQRLLVFGDSFFRQLLSPLSYFFRDIMCVRSRFFHYECIEAFAPDVVLAGCAERYLSKVYNDDVRPHFLSYPLFLGRAIDPSPQFVEFWQLMIDSRKLAQVYQKS